MKKIKTTTIYGERYVYHCPNCKRGFKVDYKKRDVMVCVCGEKFLLTYK